MREQVVIVTVICDGCGAKVDEADVTVAEITVYKKTVVADLCDKCSRLVKKIVSERGSTKGKAKAITPGTPPKKSPKEGHRPTAYLREVREWAWQNGHEVSTHGRVPDVIIHAYEQARKVAS